SGEHAGIDECGAPLRELPLVRGWKALHQEIRDCQVENRVAEELKLFVVLARTCQCGAVNERKSQEVRLTEGMTDPVLEGLVHEAHTLASGPVGRSIQPPPTTSSPRYTTTACPGATASADRSNVTRARPSPSMATRAGSGQWR